MQTNETIYVAKILNKELTAQLNRRYEILSKNPRNHAEEKLMFCYVVLSTEEFREQSANYGNPLDIPMEEISILCEEDISKLKEQIKTDRNTHKILRDTVTQLFEA